MCAPILIAAAALYAGSAIMKKRADDQKAGAEARVLNAEERRQGDYRKRMERSIAGTVDEHGAKARDDQAAAEAAKADKAGDSQVDRGLGLFTATGGNSEVARRAGTMSKGRSRGANRMGGQRRSLFNRDMSGRESASKRMGIARDAQNSYRVVPYELESAADKGADLSMLSQFVGAGAGMLGSGYSWGSVAPAGQTTASAANAQRYQALADQNPGSLDIYRNPYQV